MNQRSIKDRAIDNGKRPASSMTKRELFIKDVLCALLSVPPHELPENVGNDPDKFAIATVDHLFELMEQTEKEAEHRPRREVFVKPEKPTGHTI